MHRKLFLMILFSALAGLVTALISLPAYATSVLPKQAIDTPSIRPGKYYEVKKKQQSVPKGAKRLWADSFLWAKAPELKVEKWLTEKPDMEGKYVLIELWNTWCTHCERSIPNLNKWHAKYKDELVVVG